MTELLAISFIAGAIHVAAPDHWLPGALWSWRRGLSRARTGVFAALFLAHHLALGLLLYLVFELLSRVGPLSELPEERLFGAAVALSLLVWGLRVWRYFRLDDALVLRPNDLWNQAQILLFLGPAETLLPLLVRATQQGYRWEPAFLAFASGTLVAGVYGIVRARYSWSQTGALALRLESMRNPMQLFPVALGLLAAWLAVGV